MFVKSFYAFEFLHTVLGTNLNDNVLQLISLLGNEIYKTTSQKKKE